MRMYDMIIFDIDGTLLDTSEGILSAVRYTVNKCGLKEPNETVIKTFIGPPIKESFLNTYKVDNDVANELTRIFRERYKNVDLLKAVPYDGILEVFDMIEALNMKSAIATYKRQDYAENIVEHFGFSKYTDIIFGADKDNKMKKKDIIEKCIELSQINDYRRILMIGDSDNDAIGANQLGIDFLGVTYGFGFAKKEEVYEHNAVYAANSAYEIKKFINRGKL